MESIVKKISETKYDGICIETQHGDIRLNHSLKEASHLFEFLKRSNKGREVGVQLPQISDDGIGEDVRDKCIESAIKISREYGYKTDWIPKDFKHFTTIPLNISNSSVELNCFELSAPIFVRNYLKSFYVVEFNHGHNRWQVTLTDNFEESDIKRLDSNVYVGIVKIERGIICSTEPNKEIAVKGAGFLARLNTKSLYERTYNVDEKVLGFVIDNSFNVCHLFQLKNGEEFMGYIVNNGFGSTAIRVRLIPSFSIVKYDPYNCEYELGEERVIKKDDVVEFYDTKTESR